MDRDLDHRTPTLVRLVVAGTNFADLRLFPPDARERDQFAGWLGFAALILASINVVGGYMVTDRMLGMFRKKETKND